MLVSFLIFYHLFLSICPWKRALLLSPTHSLLRLLSDGRNQPQFLACFLAIPRSAHSILVNNVGEFFTLFPLFSPWKRALLLSPTHSLLCLLSDGRNQPQFLVCFFDIPRSTLSIL